MTRQQNDHLALTPNAHSRTCGLLPHKITFAASTSLSLSFLSSITTSWPFPYQSSLCCCRFLSPVLTLAAMVVRRTDLRGKSGPGKSPGGVLVQGQVCACLLSIFATVSNGVDTCRQVPLCWHASQCPWHRRGRCLFRYRDADADVKPPVTTTEEETGVELAALWETVSNLASSLMWRTLQYVDRAASHGGAHHEAV